MKIMIANWRQVEDVAYTIVGLRLDAEKVHGKNWRTAKSGKGKELNLKIVLIPTLSIDLITTTWHTGHARKYSSLSNALVFLA